MFDNLDPFTLTRQNEADDRARLRAAAEELAAMYRAPLPEGDAGLVAAVQRWRDLEPLHSFARRGFRYTPEDEKEILIPISTVAVIEIEKWIEETPAQGVVGVAAKLRYLLLRNKWGIGMGLDDIEDEQFIEASECGGAGF